MCAASRCYRPSRAAFQAAIAQLNEALSGLSAAGYLSSPWLGDEEAEVAAHYTSRPWKARLLLSSARLPTATNSTVSTTPSSAWRTNTVAATTTRPPTWDAGHERRALGGVLPRGDLLPRAAGARATRLRGRRGRVVHRREHHPYRRRPAHPRRQADRRRLAGPGRGGRAGRHDRDEQLGTRRRRRRVAHQNGISAQAEQAAGCAAPCRPRAPRSGTGSCRRRCPASGSCPRWATSARSRNRWRTTTRWRSR